MKYLASAEEASTQPNLRETSAPAEHRTPPMSDMLGAAVEAFVPNASAPELHPISLSSRHIDTESQRWLRGPRLIGERAHRFHLLDTSSIDYLQVEGNYVTIHVGEDRYLTRATLKYLSDVLTPYDFLRIDRSLLINLRQVEHIERLESGRFAFQLRCGHYLVSNRERSGAILRLLRSGVV